MEIIFPLKNLFSKDLSICIKLHPCLPSRDLATVSVFHCVAFMYAFKTTSKYTEFSDC